MKRTPAAFYTVLKVKVKVKLEINIVSHAINFSKILVYEMQINR